MSESENKKSLLLVQIGPVQDFISAAWSDKDLLSGSYLIAYLSAMGMKYVKEQNGEIVFPRVDEQDIWKFVQESALSAGRNCGEPTLPNRFVAVFDKTTAETAEIAAGSIKAMQNELKEIGNKCFRQFCTIFNRTGYRYEARWNFQVENFLQPSWQVVEMSDAADSWNQAYDDVLKNLAARRNTRNFKQSELGNMKKEQRLTSHLDVHKDVLTGKEEIVGDYDEWKEVCNRNGEFKQDEKYYGAMNVIKRLWWKHWLVDEKKGLNIRFKSLPEILNIREKDTGSIDDDESGGIQNYVAVIAMDGDHMGQHLGANRCKQSSFYTEFSKCLAKFTNADAKSTVESGAYGGELVYAGGDDVLAILPACNAVACARELRRKFCEVWNKELKVIDDTDFTASVGIYVAHHKDALQSMIRGAHAAEHMAKETYGRDALAVVISKRSGEIMEYGAKFDSLAWATFEDFNKLSSEDVFANRFAHALALLLKPYDLENPKHDFDPILFDILRDCEFAHVCKQQLTENRSLKERFSGDLTLFKEHATGYIEELKGAYQQECQGKDKDKKTFVGLADFAKLFLCAEFLTRRADSKNGKEDKQ